MISEEVENEGDVKKKEVVNDEFVIIEKQQKAICADELFDTPVYENYVLTSLPETTR